jgi:hypothetical protein
MLQNVEKIPLMKRVIDVIINNMMFTNNVKTFLDRCQPSYGNILKNEMRRTTNDPEFIGHGRLPDGTAVRIEGVTKVGTNGKTTMPFRIVVIPPTIYDGKETGTTIEVNNPSFF